MNNNINEDIKDQLFNQPNIIANNQNLNTNNEINNLKEELIKKDKIIEEQNNKIKDLENQINSINLQSDELQHLKNLISEKDNELEQLKKQLEDNKKNQIIVKDCDKCVNFTSQDQKVNFEISCSGESIFAQIEEQLYQKYPEYRDTNNTFLVNEKEVLHFKTINENNITNDTPIMLVTLSA